MIYDNLFYHYSFYEFSFSLASLANPQALLSIIFRQFEFRYHSPIANG